MVLQATGVSSVVAARVEGVKAEGTAGAVMGAVATEGVAREVAAMVAGSVGAATEAAAAKGAARVVARAAGAKVARGAWTEIGAPWGAAEGKAEMRVAVVQGVVQVAGTAALGG